MTLKKLRYKDWLSGNVMEILSHVLKPVCFAGMPFIEEFRINEALNWLRVLKSNERQLYIPLSVIFVNRGNADSVSLESRLDNRKSQQVSYEVTHRFSELYIKDFVQFDIFSLVVPKLKKGIVLGIALKEFERNKTLFSILEGQNVNVKFLKLINNKLFSSLIYLMIKLKSQFNYYTFKSKF